MDSTALNVVDDQAKLNPLLVKDTVFFDRDECAGFGRSLHDQYVNNDPFPHAIIDEFLPKPLLRRVVDEFPQWKPGRFADTTSNLKTGYQLADIESPYITNLMNALNSAQFLAFLEEMTGIKGLIPDPYFIGGGLHETKRGGHLSIHVDFNIHKALQLRRRLNLILFLNENWPAEYGGALELWDKDMSRCVKSAAPAMGRAVVFNTDPGSFHGHPDPLEAPDGVLRRSIALYYYTAPEEGRLPPARTTDFRPRPGSKDHTPSFKMRMRYLMRDITPPILQRALDRK